MFKNEVIVSGRILNNAQVCIYSLADLNLGHCVELAVLEGKLGFLNLFHFESESESRFNSDENCF